MFSFRFAALPKGNAFKKLIFSSLSCLYFTLAIALLAVFQYPVYAIKYILVSLPPAFFFIFLFSCVRGKIFSVILILQAIYLSIINLALLYHTALYGVPVSNEGYFVIFEAFHIEKLYENIGWFKSNFELFPSVTVFIIIGIFILLTKKTLSYSNENSFSFIIVIISVAMVVLGLYKYKSPVELFSKYQQTAIIIQYKKYQDLLAELENIRKKTSNVTLQATCDVLDKKPLFVVIIGESASRHHWGLYGYARQTTPLMAKTNNIFPFFDIVSSSCTTISSLLSALTIQKDGKRISLVDFFNAAGFTTEFYSNQPEGGQYDSFLGYIFNNIQRKYYAMKYGQYMKPDGIILDKILTAIQKNDGPKIIFVHLLGSHVDFIDRYPPEFNHFTSSEVIQGKDYLSGSKKYFAIQRINSYDNSIFYTDSLLHKIIQTTAETNRYSYVLYFSDHGEENFEFRDYYGRGGMNSTIVYDIPMILWSSDLFLIENSHLLSKKIRERKLWLGNLASSILQLSGIKNEIQDKIETTTFFMPQFIAKPRICDGIEYTTLPRPNNNAHEFN
mgnify:CR=1 FL=1